MSYEIEIDLAGLEGRTSNRKEERGRFVDEVGMRRNRDLSGRIFPDPGKKIRLPGNGMKWLESRETEGEGRSSCPSYHLCDGGIHDLEEDNLISVSIAR